MRLARGAALDATYRRVVKLGRERFCVRKLGLLFMLSYLHLELLCLVRACPLASVAVRCGRYSLGYSPAKGGAVAMTSC